MRELKYRGKIEGNWWYVRVSDKHTSGSWEQFCSLVDKKTVGEYTGLKDKTGKEIWEGDIVRINHPADMTGDFTNALGEVFWWDEEGGWYHGNCSGRPPKRMWRYVEVIGNIWEHQDLLSEVK